MKVEVVRFELTEVRSDLRARRSYAVGSNPAITYDFWEGESR